MEKTKKYVHPVWSQEKKTGGPQGSSFKTFNCHWKRTDWQTDSWQLGNLLFDN